MAFLKKLVIKAIFLHIDFSLKSNMYCYGDSIGAYPTLQEAKNTCLEDNSCKAVVDIGCAGNKFGICTGVLRQNTSGESCDWVKGKNHCYFKKKSIF